MTIRGSWGMPCLPATNNDHLRLRKCSSILAYKHPVLNPWIHHLIFIILISSLENKFIISNNYGQYLLLYFFHESFKVVFFHFQITIFTSFNMDMNVDISLPFRQCHYCDSLFLLIPVDECHLQVRVELYHI